MGILHEEAKPKVTQKMEWAVCNVRSAILGLPSRLCRRQVLFLLGRTLPSRLHRILGLDRHQIHGGGRRGLRDCRRMLLPGGMSGRRVLTRRRRRAGKRLLGIEVGEVVEVLELFMLKPVRWELLECLLRNDCVSFLSLSNDARARMQVIPTRQSRGREGSGRMQISMGNAYQKQPLHIAPPRRSSLASLLCSQRCGKTHRRGRSVEVIRTSRIGV
jgi:hypothetical protein